MLSDFLDFEKYFLKFIKYLISSVLLGVWYLTALARRQSMVV